MPEDVEALVMGDGRNETCGYQKRQSALRKLKMIFSPGFLAAFGASRVDSTGSPGNRPFSARPATYLGGGAVFSVSRILRRND
jgi:hypothetical protein